MSETHRSDSPPPAIRWWPAVLITLLGAVALGRIWLTDAANRQNQVLQTAAALFGLLFLLVLWTLLLSRMAWKLRLAIVGGLVVLGALGVGLFRIEGVSGDLVPILSFRFAGEPTYAEQAETAGAVATSPNDYPQFLGPHRDGAAGGPIEISPDWQASPPRELWRHPIGDGWSSFAVVGDAAVTQEQRGPLEMVVRYELTTGKEVWAHGDETRYETPVGGVGPRATPTIDRGQVFTLGATGILNALDLADGERLWSKNLLEEHGGALPDWGKSNSPLVVGDLVIVSAGGPDGHSLVAHHRDTGQLVWSAGDGASGYSSAHHAVLGGREQILSFNAGSVTAHAVEDGSILWSEPWASAQPNVAQPVVLDESRVLFSTGYGIGSKLFQVAPEGEGITVSELWESRRLKSKFANIVHYNGVLYGLDDGILTAVDPADGERLWKGGRYGHGQIVRKGALLIIQAEDGGVVLVEARPDAHRELARIDALNEKTWNPPALAGRYLLVRNHREAVCYELTVL